MKKTKNTSEELVTKGFFRSELKKELKEMEGRIEGKLEVKLETKLEEKFEKFEEKINDKIMTKLDNIAGQLDTMRQENTVGTHHTRELQLQVADHEKRLKQVEKIQQIS